MRTSVERSASTDWVGIERQATHLDIWITIHQLGASMTEYVFSNEWVLSPLSKPKPGFAGL